MLTALETRDANIYSDMAMDSIQAMKELISYFEDPINDMTWGEFSRAMHREILKYDDSANKVEAIYKADYQRMFCDDDEEDD